MPSRIYLSREPPPEAPLPAAHNEWAARSGDRVKAGEAAERSEGSLARGRAPQLGWASGGQEVGGGCRERDTTNRHCAEGATFGAQDGRQGVGAGEGLGCGDPRPARQG